MSRNVGFRDDPGFNMLAKRDSGDTASELADMTDAERKGGGCANPCCPMDSKMDSLVRSNLNVFYASRPWELVISNAKKTALERTENTILKTLDQAGSSSICFFFEDGKI